jgi:hypothetical protein
LLLARHNGGIVAGVVLRFFPGGVVEVAANGSLESALYLRPNDLLFWRAIEWACVEGMTKCNLGGANLFYGNSAVRSCKRPVIAWTYHCFADSQSAIGWPTGSRASVSPSRRGWPALVALCGAMSESSVHKTVDVGCKSESLGHSSIWRSFNRAERKPLRGRAK